MGLTTDFQSLFFFSALGIHSVVYSYLEDLVREGMAPEGHQES